jgi:hypothetical protein
MADKKKGGGDDEYVTLRIQCRKQTMVTTEGTVDVKVPRANRAALRPGSYKGGNLVATLNRHHCIDWGDSEPRDMPKKVVSVENLPDSDQAYRCRWNTDTNKWEFEFGEEAKA